MRLPLRLVIAIVRAWTRLDTWRLGPAVRDRRQREIESDVWEQLHDKGHAARAFAMGARVIAGMPADLRWSIEQRGTPHTPRRRAVVLAVAMVAIFAAWIVMAATSIEPPSPPEPPELTARRTRHVKAPPPPPPPPPPCNPPGLGRPAFSPCTPL